MAERAQGRKWKIVAHVTIGRKKIDTVERSVVVTSEEELGVFEKAIRDELAEKAMADPATDLSKLRIDIESDLE